MTTTHETRQVESYRQQIRQTEIVRDSLQREIAGLIAAGRDDAAEQLTVGAELAQAEIDRLVAAAATIVARW